MRRFLVALALAMPATALALPSELAHQGRLFDALAQPLDGTYDLTLHLYDTPSGGTAFWSETYTSEVFEGGYYSVAMTGIDADDIDIDDVYLAIQIDGGAELPTRIRLNAVPYAVHAHRAEQAANASAADHATTADTATSADTATTATNLSGGTVDATEIRIDGSVVIDGSGTLPAHDHSAAEIVSGTLDINRLPVGTDTDNVASGVHTHSAADLVSGTISPDRLTFGTGATDIAAGDHDHGAVTLTDDSSTPCNSTNAGMLRLNGTAFEGCVDDRWVVLGSSVNLGDSPSRAALSCKSVHDADGTLPSGVYWVDPDGLGIGEDPWQTYCDMVTDGGGWTLAGFSYMSGNSSTPTNMPSLKCGGGDWVPDDRGADKGAVNAIALAQNSTEMGLSINRSGATVDTGGMDAYEYGYKMVIPDPSLVTFDNHAYRSPTWGQSGCVATTLTGIVGDSSSETRYTKAHGLGVSWTDSYPTGYGAGDTTSCTQTYNSGAMIHSVHSGSHRGSPSGTTTNECDLDQGSWTYDHRENMTHGGTGATGSAAVWFR